jgi:hypothetical protein
MRPFPDLQDERSPFADEWASLRTILAERFDGSRRTCLLMPQ